MDVIVFGKVLHGGVGPEDGLSLCGVRLITIIKERELVDVIGRFVVAGRNFAAALVEIVLRIGGVFPEDILSPSEGLALAATRGGKRWRCGEWDRGAQFPRGGIDQSPGRGMGGWLAQIAGFAVIEAEGGEHLGNVFLLFDDFDEAQAPLAKRALQGIGSPYFHDELLPADAPAERRRGGR